MSEVRIRPADPSDPVAEVIGSAFAAAGESAALVALWGELECSDALRASLVAERAGQVVGHVGLSQAWVDARRELAEAWVLSPLSVVPGEQGRGTGTALVGAAVETARAGGTPLLFVEGDPGYYGRRGFARADRHGFAPASARTPGAAFQVVRFDAQEDWMTGQVVYRDLWWRHDAAGLRDPLLSEMEEEYR